MFAAVNGDTSSLDYYYGEHAQARRTEIDAGLDKLGLHLVPDFDSEYGRGHDEFSWRPCQCCGTSLGGARWQFAVLGEDL